MSFLNLTTLQHPLEDPSNYKIKIRHISDSENNADATNKLFIHSSIAPSITLGFYREQRYVDRNDKWNELINKYIAQSPKDIGKKYFQEYLDEITFRENYKGENDLQFYLILKQMANNKMIDFQKSSCHYSS